MGGQSTFMVEMRDIQQMTDKATERSLVIIDELGRGTSTAEGMSIAQAVIEYLHDEIGCKSLVSTHFHELSHLEGSLTHLANASMAVKEDGGDVTFLRRLVPGAASTSYGIYCARLAGLPQSIIGRAYELLDAAESLHVPAVARQSSGLAHAGAPNVEHATAAGTANEQHTTVAGASHEQHATDSGAANEHYAAAAVREAAPAFAGKRQPRCRLQMAFRRQPLRCSCPSSEKMGARRYLRRIRASRMSRLTRPPKLLRRLPHWLRIICGGSI